MAFNLSSSRKSPTSRHSFSPLSEINVTPFVDVMLVLLVIFMITAPLLTTGIPVELPKTTTAPLSEPIEPLTIVVTHEGKIFIQETETSLETLTARLKAITQNNPNVPIYVKGDQKLGYGEMITIMGLIGNAGFRKIALLTESPGIKGKARSKKINTSSSAASKG